MDERTEPQATSQQIGTYTLGNGVILQCPQDVLDSLREEGFTDADLDALVRTIVSNAPESMHDKAGHSTKQTR